MGPVHCHWLTEWDHQCMGTHTQGRCSSRAQCDESHRSNGSAFLWLWTTNGQLLGNIYWCDGQPVSRSPVQLIPAFILVNMNRIPLKFHYWSQRCANLDISNPNLNPANSSPKSLESRYYNLFDDERESGSSQILCSYLTARSGVRSRIRNYTILKLRIRNSNTSHMTCIGQIM